MKTWIRETLKKMETLRAGGTVDGLKLGDAGVTLEWIDSVTVELTRQLYS
jgi:hypothetical protein